MPRRTGLVAAAVACVLAGGCKKDSDSSESPEEKKPPGEASALWKHAPPDTRVAIIVREGAAKKVASAVQTVRDSYARLPGADQRLDAMDAEIETPTHLSPVRPETWKKAGIDVSGPAAVFVVDDGGVMLLPVTDRDAFVEAAGGRSEGEGDDRVDHIDDDMKCQERSIGYVCVSDLALLDQIGKGAVAKTGAARPAEMRGDVEIWVDGELGETPFLGIHGAALFDRGAVTLRARVEGDTSQIPPVFAIDSRTLTDRLGDTRPTGFARLHLDIGSIAPNASDAPTPFGYTGKELARALTGEIVAYTASGGNAASGYLQIGITDAEMYRTLLQKLCPLVPRMMPGAAATMEEDHCTGTLSPAAIAQEAGASLPIPATDVPFDLNVTDDALVLAINDPGKSSKSAIGRAGSDLMTGDWQLAMWGSGSPNPALTELMETPMVPEPIAQGFTWLTLHLVELGYGLRVDDDGFEIVARVGTQWANPDPVLAKLEPLIARAARGEDVTKELEKLAGANPKTPLGRSFDSGAGGLVPSVGVSGLLTAVAVPAFMKYLKKAKTSEARLFLEKLYDGARAYYMEAGSRGLQASESHFPKESVGPTPPPGSCCGDGRDQCPPDPGQWTHPTWDALRFSVADPHYYSYQYEVAEDGQSFTVRAIGDLDCDGRYSTFEMRGRADGAGGVTRGNPDIYRENELE